MSSKRHDPSKPTVYLDQSTLCDAFRAHNVAGGSTASDAVYRPLLPWIERVSRDANLCLSFIHVSELARWNDTPMATALATWLDGLPIVWVHSNMTLEESEDEVWTRRAAGVTSPDVMPFAPSLLGAFHGDVSPKAVAEFHASRHPLLYVLDAARVIRDRHAEAPFEAASAFRADRAWATAQGWSEKRGVERTEYNMRVALRTRAMEADRRLSQRHDPAYGAKTCTSGAVQDLIVDLYEHDPKALPLFRLAMLFNDGFVAASLRKDPDSAKGRAALAGSFHDALHLVGAAYCDVFTCDRVTSEWLGDFRVQIGRRVQLAVGRHPRGIEGFVEELMGTLP